MKEEKIIVFGVGNQERSMAKYLVRHIQNIIGIVDNDEQKWGQLILDKYKVEPVENILKWQDKDVVIMIATHQFHDEMKQQLKRLGWRQDILIAEEEKAITDSYTFFAYQNEVELHELTPTILNLELSGYCNCKCIYCPFHGEAHLKEGHKGFLKIDTLKAVAKQIKKIPSITTLDTTGPGEIFLNREWFQLLQYILAETQIKNMILYTNAMLLTRENIEQLLQLKVDKLLIEISIDGETEEENDRFRKGSVYKTVKSNISYLNEMVRCNAAANRKYDICITNCYPATEKEVDQFGYQVNEKTYDAPLFLQQDFPDIPIISKKTFSYGIETQQKGYQSVGVEWPENYHIRCLNLFKRIAIDYAGNLLRCSCGIAAIESIGSVFADDIMKLWKEEKELNLARRNFIHGDNKSDFCEGCPGKGMGHYDLFVKQKDQKI